MVNKPIKIGVLHSLTGTMAISESSLVDSVLLAIDEINSRGGVLGRRIQPIIADGRSNWNTFANEARRLIEKEQVCSVFGGWTSASRKTMKSVFEEFGNLLWYPVQYEGLEQSPNIVYLGAAPNQQVLPAVRWAIRNLGKRIFLVGSDYVFPRSANEIVKDEVENLGGEIVGEHYKILGDQDFNSVVEEIKKTKPDFIFNTINGDSNIPFFKQLRKEGITSSMVPTVSMSVAEDEVRHINSILTAGDYAVWNYFQSLDNRINKLFVKNFKYRYGPHRVTSDPIEKAYSSILFFAKAVEKAGNTEVSSIRNALKGIALSLPAGVATIDPHTQHLTQIVRVGRARADGQFDIVWDSKNSIKPEPYPKSRSPAEWQTFLNSLYRQWGGKWARE